MTKEMQPEALRLADAFADDDTYVSLLMMREAAAELRRLHARMQELEKELANERCLSFRAQVEQLEEQLEAQRKPLTDEQIANLDRFVHGAVFGRFNRAKALCRAIERAHGIGEAA